MQGEGYKRQTITYEAMAGDPVPAHLYLPEGSGRRKAALALHPTSELGKRIVADEGPRPHRGYGKELAQRGYVVLAPDYPTMGDPQRDPFELGYESTTMKAIYNHSRGVDLLQSLDQVDGEAIGAIGHSLGGHNALFVTVFEPRVKAAVTSCGFNSFFHYYGGNLKGWGQDKYMPIIRERHHLDPKQMPFDFTELLATIAPRPVYINAPVDDGNFEVTGRRDLVGDQALFDVVFVRQAEVLLGRHIAKHGTAEPADHRRADGGSDVVVAWRDIGYQRPQRVERRFVADLDFLVDLHLDLVHRDVARALDHRLDVVLPSAFVVQLAEGFEFGELRLVAGIGQRTGPQTVAEREADVVLLEDLADLVEVLIEQVLLVMAKPSTRRAASRRG